MTAETNPGRRPISFLSDYGHADEFVGVCHGVIRLVAPDAVVLDLAHGLPAREVRPAALVLRNALPFLPAGVHLAVVDPGVGGLRRPVALRCGDRAFVGPDNGLLWPAAERAGGVDLAVDISDSPWRLDPVSATFHGRDLFAPVAAHLALGEPVEAAGERFDPSDLVPLELPHANVSSGTVDAHALLVDRFGNVSLNVSREHLDEAGLELGGRVAVRTGRGRFESVYARTFSDAPREGLLLYEDSYGAIALAVNRGSAAAALGLHADAPVHLTGA